MPLTDFQRSVLKIVAQNRSEASHFAGGLVLNAVDESLRYSHDFDIFHDTIEMLVKASDDDVAALESAEFKVARIRGDWDHLSSYRKARVSKGDQLVEIDWATDSAWRFFPIVRDPLLGWRLHLFDMAVNKALALASRTVSRDYLDMVELGERYPLSAIVWAACGKDAGYSPLLLLGMMRRFARVDPADVELIRAKPVDLIELKNRWTEMGVEAEAEITQIADEQPDTPIGVAFVDHLGEPGWIGYNQRLTAHAGCIGGREPGA